MTRRFTGRHMAMIMVGFFAIVIGVNVVMATAAIRTFGGSSVDNSYVASQKFDSWLAQARQQAGLGWSLDTAVNPKGRMEASVSTPTGILTGARITAMAEHPLGRLPSSRFMLREDRPGQYVADRALPVGRWRVRLLIERDERSARFVEEVRR